MLGKKQYKAPAARTCDIRKNDTVVVLSGAEKGKTGRVLSVFPRKGTVLVERIALTKRHTKAGRQGQQQGGIVEKEAAIPLSKVALIDPRTGKGTRTRHQVLADGSKVRAAARSGEVLEKV
jgi:large subunit ribosomal protein L24